MQILHVALNLGHHEKNKLVVFTEDCTGLGTGSKAIEYVAKKHSIPVAGEEAGESNPVLREVIQENGRFKRVLADIAVQGRFKKKVVTKQHCTCVDLNVSLGLSKVLTRV